MEVTDFQIKDDASERDDYGRAMVKVVLLFPSSPKAVPMTFHVRRDVAVLMAGQLERAVHRVDAGG